MSFKPVFHWLSKALDIPGASAIMICHDSRLMKQWYTTDITDRLQYARVLAATLLKTTTTSRASIALAARILSYLYLQDTKPMVYADSSSTEAKTPKKRKNGTAEPNEVKEAQAKENGGNAKDDDKSTPLKPELKAPAATTEDSEASIQTLQATIALLRSDLQEARAAKRSAEADGMLQALRHDQAIEKQDEQAWNIGKLERKLKQMRKQTASLHDAIEEKEKDFEESMKKLRIENADLSGRVQKHEALAQRMHRHAQMMMFEAAEYLPDSVLDQDQGQEQEVETKPSGGKDDDERMSMIQDTSRAMSKAIIVVLTSEKNRSGSRNCRS